MRGYLIKSSTHNKEHCWGAGGDKEKRTIFMLWGVHGNHCCYPYKKRRRKVGEGVLAIRGDFCPQLLHSSVDIKALFLYPLLHYIVYMPIQLTRCYLHMTVVSVTQGA